MSRRKPYDVPSSVKLKDGRPPTANRWYIATDSGDMYVWRWWDGSYWSYPARAHHSAKHAAAQAAKTAYGNRRRPIKWTDWRPVGTRELA